MYKIAKIYIKSKIDDTEEFIDDAFEFLGMLYKNGQILYDYIVESYSDHLVANVTITDVDALNSKYFNSYILDILNNLEYSFDVIADSTISGDSCKCEDHDFYILGIFHDNDLSPILCGNCGEEIPLIHVPYIDQTEEHFSILYFQREFKAVERLWMSSLSDRFTKRQLTSYNSRLTKNALEICRSLEKEVYKPVLYLLPLRDSFDVTKREYHVDVCPNCQDELEIIENNESISKVCWKCKLAFEESE